MSQDPTSLTANEAATLQAMRQTAINMARQAKEEAIIHRDAPKGYLGVFVDSVMAQIGMAISFLYEPRMHVVTHDFVAQNKAMHVFHTGRSVAGFALLWSPKDNYPLIPFWGMPNAAEQVKVYAVTRCMVTDGYMREANVAAFGLSWKQKVDFERGLYPAEDQMAAPIQAVLAYVTEKLPVAPGRVRHLLWDGQPKDGIPLKIA